ncbi:uncharacterized protein B0H18DRAFT_1124792 [Fomitopsis serialis]|uniref:uncharacterized protein n=1 Tax=Fomitopsis serialis TaxID=139415 RepID=UPI00200885D9|nr:uncharacterized protein B0H18DRAFT_1124792 [Neoantrodia serialis]KAH9915655.1 hypothetical protein B0H18DRAFT_1124792 [Neoantrodia serialis]
MSLVPVSALAKCTAPLSRSPGCVQPPGGTVVLAAYERKAPVVTFVRTRRTKPTRTSRSTRALMNLAHTAGDICNSSTASCPENVLGSYMNQTAFPAKALDDAKPIEQAGLVDVIVIPVAGVGGLPGSGAAAADASAKSPCRS